VGFTLAAQIFGDPLLQTVQDHAIDSEERWNSTGSTPKGNLLFVVHNVWSEESGEVIRIISARKATRRERTAYEEGH